MKADFLVELQSLFIGPLYIVYYCVNVLAGWDCAIVELLELFFLFLYYTLLAHFLTLYLQTKKWKLFLALLIAHRGLATIIHYLLSNSGTRSRQGDYG
jgi:hypothetical protein